MRRVSKEDLERASETMWRRQPNIEGEAPPAPPDAKPTKPWQEETDNPDPNWQALLEFNRLIRRDGEASLTPEEQMDYSLLYERFFPSG
jgi:hypothetical protein